MVSEISAIPTAQSSSISQATIETGSVQSTKTTPKLESVPIAAEVDTAIAEAIKPREQIRIDTESVMSKEDLSTAIQSLNEMMSALDRNIAFSVDPGTGKDIVKVTDSNTGKTIRQIPAQETLTFIQNLDRMVGLLFDQKT